MERAFELREPDVPKQLAMMREKPLVVLAEDDEDTRRVYALILRHSGYEVEEVVNGVDAVDVTRTVQPSLVLMDIGLPGIDGWQASRLLKADPVTAGIPLIAFSARVDSTADFGGRATFDGFILKPISPKELVKRVGAYLQLLGVGDGRRDPRSFPSPIFHLPPTPHPISS